MAQARGNPVVSLTAYGELWAVTTNGDVYISDSKARWSLVGNVFANPTPATRETLGALKSRYRGAVQPTAEGK